jgi:hypothetical protein
MSSRCSPENASRASGSVPVVETTVTSRSRARADAASSSADLPIPASPRTTSAPPRWPIPSITA